jgi:hypothetical protein
MLSQASIVALLSLLIAVLPLGFGIAYVLSPTEQRLALMRPITLAATYGALTGTISGFINSLRAIWMSQGEVNWRIVSVGVAESLVTLHVAFACLTIAWLCVVLGLRRRT